LVNAISGDGISASWIHKVELEVPKKAIMQITLISAKPNHFGLKLINSAGGIKKSFHTDIV